MPLQLVDRKMSAAKQCGVSLNVPGFKETYWWTHLEHRKLMARSMAMGAHPHKAVMHSVTLLQSVERE
jgi:hypothetical protein